MVTKVEREKAALAKAEAAVAEKKKIDSQTGSRRARKESRQSDQKGWPSQRACDSRGRREGKAGDRNQAASRRLSVESVSPANAGRPDRRGRGSMPLTRR